jgi:hypothetical protein
MLFAPEPLEDMDNIPSQAVVVFAQSGTTRDV